jgi:hypothetical protein
MAIPRLAPEAPAESARGEAQSVDAPWTPVPRASAGRALAVIALVYFLASLVAGPVFPGRPSAVAHWKLGRIYLGRPIVTWGDSPHYLVMVNSLLDGHDLDLRDDYDHALAGGDEAGTRWRRFEIDRHVETDLHGRELSVHPSFVAMLLAPVAWPFRGGEWVESVCIWTTLALTLLGVAWCARKPEMDARWLAALAFATPLWVYARDLGTEAVQATAWAGLVTLESPLALAALTIAGILVKAPFAVVPMTLGVVMFLQRRRRNGIVLVAATVAGLAMAVGIAQWIYRDADHFSLLHLSGGHMYGSPTRWRGVNLEAVVGLLFGPENGLLPWSPFLVLGAVALVRDARLFVPALSYFLLHASYGGWRGGSGVSARYLVPMLPVLVIAVARARPSGKLPALLLAYSGVVCGLAAVLPVAAYDKTPWAMIAFLSQRLGLLAR